MNTVPHSAFNDNSYTVYALIDPRDYTTRYIGITNDVYARFAQHIRCDGSNLEKDAWIAQLKAENIMLIMKTLETVESIERARERETHWIHHYRFLGTLLLNQQIPTIHIAPDPPLPQIPSTSYRGTGSRPGRKYNYTKIQEFVLYRHIHGKWNDELSQDMKEWYEFNYFTPPRKKKDGDKFEQHKAAYQRGRMWIYLYESASLCADSEPELFGGENRASEAM